MVNEEGGGSFFLQGCRAREGRREIPRVIMIFRIQRTREGEERKVNEYEGMTRGKV